MKILLLNPPFLPRFSRSSRSPATTKGGTVYYPYFLAYCAGVLEQRGFDIKLIDAVARKWSHKKTVEFIKAFGPDLVVIDTSTPSINNDVTVAERIKDALPNTHVTLVGTHPTALTNETFALSSSIDSICRGEYDYTVAELASAIESGESLRNIGGLSFRTNKRIVHNQARKLITNLDELPFVSGVYKKHLKITNYFYASVTHPEVTILTARGCPYSCSFCNIPFKASYRARSPENVVDEFEYIQKELPEVREVMIEDDTFPVSKQRTIDICNLMIKRKIKVKWSCNARVNTDFETLKKMKEAGCRLLCVGFESPEQTVLDSVDKKTTKESQINFMKNAKKVGLLVNGCFILGLPSDSEETIEKTVEFAKDLNPDTAQFYPIMVYPGTESYEWAEKNGYLTTKDYTKWVTREGMHTTTVSRPALSAERLTCMCDEARRNFYLRPTYILSKLKQITTNPKETKRVFMGSAIFLRHILKRRAQGEMK